MKRIRRDFPLPGFVTAAEPVCETSCRALIAFRDCDPMGVLWHGNYLAYCEFARHELGLINGLSVQAFMQRALFAPVVRSQVMYKTPLRAEEMVTIDIALYPSEQARLYHRYHFWIGDRLAASAETEQVFTDEDFTVLLRAPDDIRELLAGEN